MGKQINIKLQGSSSNLIYYEWKGIPCIRTKPVNPRLSAETREQASLFGMAANRSAITRALLHNLLPGPKSRQIMYETNKAFRLWLATGGYHSNLPMEHIAAFQMLSFNEACSLTDICHADFTISKEANGELIASLPALNPLQQFNAPAHTGSIELQWAALGIPVLEEAEAFIKISSCEMPYNQGPTQPIQIPLQAYTAMGRLSLVVLALQYKNEQGQLVQNKDWRPVSVLGSFYNA